MRAIAKIFVITIAVLMITACCDRRCAVSCQKAPEPINLQEKLIKMKEQAGGKGSK